MPITFKCACQQSLKVRDELAGKSVKCPKCAKVTQVPAPAPAAAAEPELQIVGEKPAADPDFRIQEEAPAPPRRPAGAARPSMRPAPTMKSQGNDDLPYLLRGLAGGFVAALLGAFVWYLLAKGIKAKIGWVAWGIGWATGFGAVVLSGGRGGVLLCAIGAGTALLGWLMGEYMIFSWMFQDLVEKEVLARVAKTAQSQEVREAVHEAMATVGFGDYLKATFGGMDAIFILLAAATGWGVPQKMGAG